MNGTFFFISTSTAVLQKNIYMFVFLCLFFLPVIV